MPGVCPVRGSRAAGGSCGCLSGSVDRLANKCWSLLRLLPAAVACVKPAAPVLMESQWSQEIFSISNSILNCSGLPATCMLSLCARAGGAAPLTGISGDGAGNTFIPKDLP